MSVWFGKQEKDAGALVDVRVRSLLPRGNRTGLDPFGRQRDVGGDAKPRGRAAGFQEGAQQFEVAIRGFDHDLGLLPAG